MEIKDLAEDKNFKNLIAEIIELSDSEEVAGGLTLQRGVLKDNTGKIDITFWDKDVRKFKIGDKIIMDGYCKRFHDDLQISSGKYGKIHKIPPQRVH